MNLPRAMPPLALLAGGLATRLHPMTEKVPKAMLEVAGEPFIAHQLRLVKRNGLERVVICAGYLGEQIQNFVRDGARFGVAVTYSFDFPGLLGTGGALKNALGVLGESFFVMYGDSYLDTSFRAVFEAFESSSKLGLMTVFRNDNRWDASNVEFDQGVIRCYDKRSRTPAMAHIDYGLSILRAAALDPWPSGEPFDLAEVCQQLVVRGELAGYEVKRRFYEIGSPEGLAEAELMLREENSDDKPLYGEIP